MQGDPANLATAILELLAESKYPQKARVLTRALSCRQERFIQKSAVNQSLYGMEKRGLVNHDAYFQWSLGPVEAPVASTQGSDTREHARTRKTKAVVQLGSAAPVASTQSSDTREHARTRKTKAIVQLGSAAPACGPLSYSWESRNYPVFCSWCAAAIMPEEKEIVVRLNGKYHRKFCRRDCLLNWEAIYWQRKALKRLELSTAQLRKERRIIKDQIHSLGFGWH